MDFLLGFLPAVASLTALGAIFGGILGFASKLFAVETDERVPQILEVLPSANCGGCGFAGCAAFAESVAEGAAPTNGCIVGGAVTAAKVAAIMGTVALDVDRMLAIVHCAGRSGLSEVKYDYHGFDDCHAVNSLSGGPKKCSSACIGLGSCVRVCHFGAMTVRDGIAVVDRSLCTGCGACVKACPKGIIKLSSETSHTHILCSNHQRGAALYDACKIGCIACGICVKSCPQEAIALQDHLAVIDSSHCINCNACVEKCPKKIITGTISSHTPS